MSGILILLLLTAAPDDSVAELIRRLGDDVAAVRDAGAAALTARGRAILPELENALAAQTDTEVHERLKRIIRDLTQIRWHTDLDLAKRKAAAEKKPLVVFSTLGPLDGFV